MINGEKDRTDPVLHANMQAEINSRFRQKVALAQQEYNDAIEKYMERLAAAEKERRTSMARGWVPMFVTLEAEWLGIRDYGREVRLRVGETEFTLNQLQAQTAGKMTEPNVRD